MLLSEFFIHQRSFSEHCILNPGQSMSLKRSHTRANQRKCYQKRSQDLQQFWLISTAPGMQFRLRPNKECKAKFSFCGFVALIEIELLAVALHVLNIHGAHAFAISGKKHNWWSVFQLLLDKSLTPTFFFFQSTRCCEARVAIVSALCRLPHGSWLSGRTVRIL